jgi:hypothetical protein
MNETFGASGTLITTSQANVGLIEGAKRTVLALPTDSLMPFAKMVALTTAPNTRTYDVPNGMLRLLYVEISYGDPTTESNFVPCLPARLSDKAVWKYNKRLRPSHTHPRFFVRPNSTGPDALQIELPDNAVPLTGETGANRLRVYGIVGEDIVTDDDASDTSAAILAPQYARLYALAAASFLSGILSVPGKKEEWEQEWKEGIEREWRGFPRYHDLMYSLTATRGVD